MDPATFALILVLDAAAPGAAPVTIPQTPFTMTLDACRGALGAGMPDIIARGKADLMCATPERLRAWNAWFTPFSDAGPQ